MSRSTIVRLKRDSNFPPRYDHLSRCESAFSPIKLFLCYPQSYNPGTPRDWILDCDYSRVLEVSTLLHADVIIWEGTD